MIELDERRRGIRDTARRFVREEVLPLAAELDPRGEDMPWALVDRLAELGYLGATVPEAHGGLGYGMVDYCLLIEELSRGWLSVASVVGRGNRILDEVLTTDELRANHLPRIARGGSSARSRCPRWGPARTSPASPVRPGRPPTAGRSPARRIGAGSRGLVADLRGYLRGHVGDPTTDHRGPPARGRPPPLSRPDPATDWSSS